MEGEGGEEAMWFKGGCDVPRSGLPVISCRDFRSACIVCRDGVDRAGLWESFLCSHMRSNILTRVLLELAALCVSDSVTASF